MPPLLPVALWRWWWCHRGSECGSWWCRPVGDGEGQGEGGGVKRPCCLRLSAFLNQRRPEYQQQQQQHRFSQETGNRGIQDGSGSCGCLWALYSHMRPLGLKVLHAGQDLLLVTSQGHPHLSQFTK